ncbi:uncharacterized protein LOC136079546 isoform X3 [Hydra vulgaris]|uniref:Uncharacterized protein LOC136079546 isoform X3 n=1 Tax=Hydra vulgaris TaxID=6087 RepID=A0ABM4BQN3_HYDVU
MLPVFLFCVSTFLTNSKAQFIYPERKLSSRYSFTVFQDRQITYSTSLVETHRDYKDCITACYNIFDRCKSIDIQIVSNTTIICRFFREDSPPTQLAKGNLFVSTKPPKCSLSCSLTSKPCGKCKCYPSCSAKNRRQHICNCTTAAGITKSCQEHYNNGFTQTGVFKIISNGFPIETMCEMDKVEHKNPKINTQKCMQQPSAIMSFSFALSVSYCVITCAQKKYDTVIFNTPCFCASYIDVDNWCNGRSCTRSEYCKIEVNEQAIQNSNLITTLSFLDKTFSISFMLKPMSNRGMLYNIIHFTIYGNIGYYGERIPGVWLDEYSRLCISFALNGNTNYDCYTPQLSLNVWSSLIITQTELNGDYTYTIYLNDKIVINIRNTQPQFFKNVNVYASDPWHNAFDGYIKDLKIVNGYVDFVDEVSELVIKKNNLIALLSYLDEAYSVSFKIKPNSYSNGWKSVIHLTIGKDLDNYGDRTPALFFCDDSSGRLYITSAVNGNKNYMFITQPLPLNQWSSIQISQIRLNEKYVFSVYLNESMVHSIENTKPQSFENLKVYAASPWFDAQDGSIKDVKVISGSNGVWIPMMTRFASWETTFWDKTYESYENGFGLVNQQWIGLKNLNQITSTFFTDMRIDYAFKEDITFSTMYYNVTIGSSEEKYIFQYEKYNPRGSGEPDRFNVNGMVFNNCSNWWTADGQNNGNCNKNMFPTSTNYISFGSAKELLSIQFFLRTNLEKDFSSNAP